MSPQKQVGDKRAFHEARQSGQNITISEELHGDQKSKKFLEGIFLTTSSKVKRFRKAKRALRKHNRQGADLRDEYDEALYDMINPIDGTSESSIE